MGAPQASLSPWSLLLLFVIAGLAPATAAMAEPSVTPSRSDAAVSAPVPGVDEAALIAMSGHIDFANVSSDDLRPYGFIDAEQPVYSATPLLKRQWVEAGRPGLVLPFSEDASRTTSGRACEAARSESDTGSINTASGTISFEVEKVTTNAAILVDTSVTPSASVINNLAQTWESTIFPTESLYFGTPPDVDNNCQIQIVVTPMDGAFGTGGYFVPSFSGSHDSVYVDSADIDQAWAQVILAHEFEHLLHNARDPFEYNWLDEGAADYAAYLCFGQDSTLVGHANSWSSNGSQGVRWWNQRQGDYGAGFLFVMYVSEWLGGAQGVQSLIADTDTGGTGVENLARSGVDGKASPIGTDFSDIFANFTTAVLLDSDDTGFGFPSLNFINNCSGQFCKLQTTGVNNMWSGIYTSSGNTMDGWGVHAWRLAGGSGSTLNLRLLASEQSMGGRVLSHDAATGVWSAVDMPFNASQATGFVPSFGDATDDVYVLAWYESAPSDCDYTGCGDPYPSATVQLDAALITEPATLSMAPPTTFDRDLDGTDDSLELQMTVNSTAFAETLDLEVTVRDASGMGVDTITIGITAGGNIPVGESLWFTPARNGTYTLSVRLLDQLGIVIDTAATTPQVLANMQPVASGQVGATVEQTWTEIIFQGSGTDHWGFGEANGSFLHSDPAVGYLWDFGDANTSTLRNPTHAYRLEGDFNITLSAQDVGGAWSPLVTSSISIADDSTPVPHIHLVGGAEITSNVSVFTNQRLLFSAAQTRDNVPPDGMRFTWDFGDGNGTSGVTAHHAWEQGTANGTTYDLTLTVNDTIHEASLTVQVIVFNRPPRQIWEAALVVPTLTPLTLPPIMTDDDGVIVNYDWDFGTDPVNLDGSGVGLTSTFDQLSSTRASPTPAWPTPGDRTINVTVVDDGGNLTVATLLIRVQNQWPVASFDRPVDGTVNTEYTFDGRNSFDPDSSSSLAPTAYNWTFSDSNLSVTGVSVVMHQFVTPGSHTVTLVVTDEHGDQSVAKTYVVRIANPPPLAEMQVLEAWLNGSPVMDDTPRGPGAQFTYSHAFVHDDGSVFAAPGLLLRFLSTGTRDGDARFAGLSDPDITRPEWNGIVQYTWDFGDASPPSHSSTAWHAYERPGVHTATLTVRDGFGTGDTTTVTRRIVIDSAPVIEMPSELADEIIHGQGYSLFGIATDAEVDAGLVASRDVLLDTDEDGDGDPMNDHGNSLLLLNEGLDFFWDLDHRVDADGDGDARNDWFNAQDLRLPADDPRRSMVWQEAGPVELTLKVCDGLLVCSELTISGVIHTTGGDNNSNTSFSWESLIPEDSGNEGMLTLVLVALVAVFAWLLLRSRDVEEVEAEEAAGTYNANAVRADGGVLGMDQHVPPPRPRQLSRDDRTSEDSGYTRPVRLTRRR